MANKKIITRDIDAPAGAAAGQGYLDSLARHRKAQAALNRQKALEKSNTPTKTNQSSQGGPNTRGNKDLSKPTFGNVLEEFQGGELSRRQKRLIRKGKTSKARTIGQRKRRRMLKRGGEVSSSWQASTAPGKGNYRRASKVMSMGKDGKVKKTRLGEGGSYDFKGRNKTRTKRRA